MSGKLIISLTSHGRRLAESAPHAIYSLLNQTHKADKVILYLDTNDAATAELKNIAGLEIREGYEPIKSYSKLVWALQEFPDDTIITADDDCFYALDSVEHLVKHSAENPACIVGTCMRQIEFEADTQFKLYREWQSILGKGIYPAAFPLGVGMILYPPNSFYADVANSQLFKEIAPTADDMWFWAMAVLKGTKHFLAGASKLWSNIFEFKHAGDSTLMFDNFRGGGNRRALRALEAKYPQLHQLIRDRQAGIYG